MLFKNKSSAKIFGTAQLMQILTGATRTIYGQVRPAAVELIF